MKKALLLNSNHEVLSFVTGRKAINLIFRNKVDVISSWDEELIWSSGKMNFPATLRLLSFVPTIYFIKGFNKKALIKRDNYSCQYCFKKLSPSQITVDHVFPKAFGGQTSFTNCVVSCWYCNNYKGNRTPEQAGMRLLTKPSAPTSKTFYLAENYDYWHQDWDFYFK
jgi:HNH endonuclease